MTVKKEQTVNAESITKLPLHIPITSVVFREDLYPRAKPDPRKIQEYSDKATDLGNVDLELFLTTLADITKAAKRDDVGQDVMHLNTDAWTIEEPGDLALVLLQIQGTLGGLMKTPPPEVRP